MIGRTRDGGDQPSHSPDLKLLGKYYDAWYRKIRERAERVGYSPSDQYNEIVKQKLLREAVLQTIGQPGPRAWLDYGCGPAYLFKEYPIPDSCRCVGIDLSPSIVAADRQAFQGRHNFTFATVEEDYLRDVAACTFDLVTMVEVLEHVYGAESVLASIRKCMKIGARLVLTTPNRMRAATLLRAALPRAWVLRLEDRRQERGIDELEEQDEELGSFGVQTHFHEYSPKELATLLQKSGFELLSIHRTALKVVPNSTFNAIAKRAPGFSAWMAFLDAATKNWPIAFFKTGMMAVAVKS